MDLLDDIDDEKEEIFIVIDRSLNGVYLQNLKTNVIIEETNLPQELLDKIGNDYILRYINGDYYLDMNLTEKFMNGIE